MTDGFVAVNIGAGSPADDGSLSEKNAGDPAGNRGGARPGTEMEARLRRDTWGSKRLFLW